LPSFREQAGALTLRSGVLLSLLLHLLLLRVLVGESGFVEPTPRAYRELPVLVGWIEETPLELRRVVVDPGAPDRVAAVEEPGTAEVAGSPAGEEGSRDSTLPSPFDGPILEPGPPPFTPAPGSVDFVGPAVVFEGDAPPFRLNDSRWEGEVRLGVYVSPEGCPEKVWIIEGSGRREADLDALDYLRKTRWRPATFNGEPTGWVVERTVVYRQPAIFW
jgi:TonB family protein